MPEDYREYPSFNHYYVAEDLKQAPRAPFPVSVLKLGDDVEREDSFLGIGHVIGCLETPSETIPVIKVDDVEDKQAYTLLGTECSWTYPPPKETTDAIMDGSLAISSVRRYIDTRSAERNLTRLNSELRTVADHALHTAAEMHTFTDRMLFTGRVLVKQTHENMYLQDPVEPNDAVQYFAPELRMWVKPLFKMVVAGFKEDGHPRQLLFNRILSLNQAAKMEPETVSVYSAKGKI